MCLICVTLECTTYIYLYGTLVSLGNSKASDKRTQICVIAIKIENYI